LFLKAEIGGIAAIKLLRIFTAISNSESMNESLLKEISLWKLKADLKKAVSFFLKTKLICRNFNNMIE